MLYQIDKKMLRAMALYIAIMLFIFFVGDEAFRYNFLFFLIFFTFLFSLNKNTILQFLFFSPFLFIIPLFQGVHDFKFLAYLTQDFLMVFFIFLLTFFILNGYISEKVQIGFFVFCVAYTLLYFLFSLNTSFYNYDLGVERYVGITGSTNVSSTIASLLIIYIWEYFKKNKKDHFILFFLMVVMLSFIFYLSKSRSLLFIFPYVFWQIFIVPKSTFLRIPIYILSCFLVVSILLCFDILSLFKQFRIDSDSSFNTRNFITAIIFSNIKESYFIFPNGFNSGNEFLAKFLGEERYPIHNDFLKIWYEWGIGGVIFIILTLGRICFKCRNVNDLCIVLFFCSGALHNILYLFYIWIPLVFIFCMKNSKKI